MSGRHFNALVHYRTSFVKVLFPILTLQIMLIVPSHVVRMFARTTLLVVGIGLWHGLCILPVAVLIALKIRCPKKLRNKVSSAKLDNSISSSTVANTA